MTSSTDDQKIELGCLVGQEFRLGEKLGEGSCGVVYKAVKISGGEEVAVKLELKNHTKGTLRRECLVYRELAGGYDIPRYWWYGQHQNYNVLVVERLGLSLEDLFSICGLTFSLKTVLHIGVQMLNRLEYLHSKSFIHRDIKPANCLMGVGSQSNKIYLIDYGVAKRYILNGNEHIKYSQRKKAVGTVRYASLRATLAFEQSRRDDLESLGFMLIYFLRGSLPWQGIKSATHNQRNALIAENKRSTSMSSLCEGHSTELAAYMTYCRNLIFEETPDYSYLRNILRSSHEQTTDFAFDWTASMDPRVVEMLQGENHSQGKTSKRSLSESDEEPESSRKMLKVAPFLSNDIVLAVRYEGLNKVQKIVENQRFDINDEADGQSLLLLAATYGRLDIMEYLISKGANVNTTDKRGITPLLAAILNENVEIVELLLRKGASKDGNTTDGRSYLEEVKKEEIRNLLA